MTKLKAIDLFASAGGMTIGLRQAEIQTVCAVEIDPHRVATFASHSKADILVTDIRKADFTPYRGKVELICGGSIAT
jgi:DNA (cytosine-5)-methyltransferase 1